MRGSDASWFRARCSSVSPDSGDCRNRSRGRPRSKRRKNPILLLSALLADASSRGLLALRLPTSPAPNRALRSGPCGCKHEVAGRATVRVARVEKKQRLVVVELPRRQELGAQPRVAVVALFHFGRGVQWHQGLEPTGLEMDAPRWKDAALR
jgi:hypothetical protein